MSCKKSVIFSFRAENIASSIFFFRFDLLTGKRIRFLLFGCPPCARVYLSHGTFVFELKSMHGQAVNICCCCLLVELSGYSET